MKRLRFKILIVLAALAVVAAACGDDDAAPTAAPTAGPAATDPPVTQPPRVDLVMQLTWVPQSQFAGYIMADAKGFYDEENLNVTVLAGGPDVSPDQQILTGAADLTLGKGASIFVARSRGVPLVAVAQFHRKSGFPIVAMADSGIRTPRGSRWQNGGSFPGWRRRSRASRSRGAIRSRSRSGTSNSSSRVSRWTRSSTETSTPSRRPIGTSFSRCMKMGSRPRIS